MLDSQASTSVDSVAPSLQTSPPATIGEAEVESLIAQNLPEATFTRLFPFQKAGVRFGIQHQGRLLLGDEMGLGKTMQVLGSAQHLNQ